MLWPCTEKIRGGTGKNSTPFRSRRTATQRNTRKTWKGMVKGDQRRNGLRRRDAMDRGRWRRGQGLTFFILSRVLQFNLFHFFKSNTSKLDIFSLSSKLLSLLELYIGHHGLSPTQLTKNALKRTKKCNESRMARDRTLIDGIHVHSLCHLRYSLDHLTTMAAALQEISKNTCRTQNLHVKSHWNLSLETYKDDRRHGKLF